MVKGEISMRRHDANQVENELEPFCRLRYSAQPAHASPPPLEFSEIKRRIQFAVDFAEQRLNAVFFADYTADSNSVRFEFQLSGLIQREHHRLELSASLVIYRQRLSSKKATLLDSPGREIIMPKSLCLMPILPVRIAR
jgi:hypothetical protein